ncbi:MAG: DUF5996 family protein [Myxococcota bacterium]
MSQLDFALPELPYDDWEPTKAAVHLIAQIMGKVKLALHPKHPHWWHATLRVATRGITTGTIPVGDRNLELLLDIRALEMELTTSEGVHRRISLQDRSISDIHTSVTDALAQAGHPVNLLAKPYDMPHSDVPFPKDLTARNCDISAIERWWHVMRFVHDVFETFAGRSYARTSPVQLFWHSFDFVVTRFTGRRAPGHGQGDRRSDVEAYSHEVVSFGFWPGDPNTRFPGFYSYTAPEPEGLADKPLRPTEAWWQELPTSHLAMLKYDDVRAADDPRETLLAFLQSAWEAGASLAAVQDLDGLSPVPLWDELDERFPKTKGRERR